MRWISYIACFMLIISANAQIIEQPLSSVNTSSNLRTSQNSDPLNLPFWDDFSTSTHRPNSNWEFSSGVTISNALSVLAPSFNAANLDGVDSTGNLYDATKFYSTLTDQLISRRIDLSDHLNDNTVFLSFFWEAGGLAQIPEHEGDSLRLQFLNADSTWVTVWKRVGNLVNTYDEFSQSILQVTGDYMHEDFRFKFENFGSPQGPWDNWHLDYIYLNDGRTLANLTYLDRTMSGKLTSFLSDYYEMPAEHFFTDPSAFTTWQSLESGNLQADPYTLELDYELILTNTEDTIRFVDDQNFFLGNEIKKITLAQQPVMPDLDPVPDSLVFINTVSSNFNDATNPINYRVNDTLRNTYLFHEHYSYDDGSAESSAGVRQNGSVAIRYVIPVRDTLTHVEIFFPRVYPASVNKTMNVKVWRRLDGSSEVATGKLTIEESSIGQFVRVPLATAVIVSDTIYVGYTQNSVDYVGVGLDLNNETKSDEMYFVIGNDWKQNTTVPGIMMIRPVFEIGGDPLLSTRETFDFNFYPNPTSGELRIEGHYEEIIVRNLSGQLLFREEQQIEHDLSFLEKGLYLVEIATSSGESQVIKILKR
jgi:hypothetical protein